MPKIVHSMKLSSHSKVRLVGLMTVSTFKVILAYNNLANLLQKYNNKQQTPATVELLT